MNPPPNYFSGTNKTLILLFFKIKKKFFLKTLNSFKCG